MGNEYLCIWNQILRFAFKASHNRRPLTTDFNHKEILA